MDETLQLPVIELETPKCPECSTSVMVQRCPWELDNCPRHQLRREHEKKLRLQNELKQIAPLFDKPGTLTSVHENAKVFVTTIHKHVSIALKAVKKHYFSLGLRDQIWIYAWPRSKFLELEFKNSTVFNKVDLMLSILEMKLPLVKKDDSLKEKASKNNWYLERDGTITLRIVDSALFDTTEFRRFIEEAHKDYLIL